MAEKCRSGCIYWQAEPGCCIYWEIEDRLRGCPPGKKCTKYRRGKRKPQSLSIRAKTWDVQKAKRMAYAGYSDDAISAYLGVPVDTIRYLRKTYWMG